MSWEENESCLSYEGTCQFDAEVAKKKVRTFWYYVLGFVILMLIPYFIGSCMGCEACFQCAAACDASCGDCGLEDCGRSCYSEVGCGSCNGSGTTSGGSSGSSASCQDSCDACVKSEGSDCGNTKGCGACAGFGDCSACGGYEVYRVKIKVGDQTIEKEFTNPKADVEIVYPNGASSEYVEFQGYFTKKEGGTCYVDSTGKTIKSFKDGMTLYGHYKEINEGEEYTFAFDPGNAPAGEFNIPSSISVFVGQEVTDFPEAQEIDGYTFLGWYTAYEDGKCVSNAEGGYKSDAFHLYDLGVSPNDDSTYPIILYARYERAKYDVRIIETVDGSQKKIETVKITHGDVLWSEASDTIASLRDNDWSNYKFLGYSQRPNPDITNSEELLTENDLRSILVVEPTSIYIIKRSAVILTFHYGIDGKSDVTYDGYHGETVDLSNVYDSSYGGYITETVLRDGFNKGYEFDSWSRSTSSADVEITTIDVRKGGITNFYARWKELTYTIEYYYDTYRYGYADGVRSQHESYTYKNGLAELFNPGRSDEGDFVGWLCNGRLITKIDAKSVYGNLKLYAQFTNSSSLSAPIGGVINPPAGQSVAMSLTDTVACGFVQGKIKEF